MTCSMCGADVSAGAATCAACGMPAVTVPGTLLAGRYEIQTLIGSGALGRVFRAHDRALNEVVAIKVLHPETAQSAELTQRFRNEIRLARRVRHVNVCAIHEYGEDGPLQFVAMEFVDGVDLQRELRASGPLPADAVFDVAQQMARGLAAIHDAGVIHRDLKTSNIVRDKRGAVRLLDFGIAKRSSSTGTLALTGGERVVGTPEYMSPEQIKGGDLDPRSDLYSFGVVLFELCTGTLPFEGKTPLDTMLRQVNEPPPLYGARAALIPASLVSLLRRALAKDPAGRPASARDLETELLFAQRAAFPEAVRVLEPPPLVAAPPPAPESRRPPQLPLAPPPPPTPPRGAERPTADPADRTEVLPRRAAPPRPPTPPPPPLVAAREAAAAAALDGERTFIELPQLPQQPPPLRQPPPLPSGAGEGPRRSRLPIALLAGIGLAVIGLLLVVRARLGNDNAPATAAADAAPSPPAAAPAAAPAATPAATPSPATTPTPALAAVTPAVSPPPEVPEVGAAPAPAAAPTPRAARRVAPTPAPSPTPTPDPVATPSPPLHARLTIDARPRSEVEVDGRPYGLTPIAELTIEPGVHAVEVSHPDYWPRRELVLLLPGSLRTLDVDLAWEGVRHSDTPPYRVPGAQDAGLLRAAGLVAEMRWREAVDELSAVVARLQAEKGRRGDLARAHFYLGVAYLELDEATRATASFTAALAQDRKLKPPAGAFPARVVGFFNHVREEVEKGS